jgi:hypothetical protein
VRKHLTLIILIMPLTLKAIGLPKELEVPGGIALVPVETVQQPMPTVRFNDAQVAIAKTGGMLIAVIGIPLSTDAGKYWLEIRWPSGTRARQSFTVKPKRYETQHITLPDERKIQPLPQDLERITHETAIIQRVVSTWSEQPPDFTFTLPVEGPITSVYGLRRYFNNQPRSPHSGLDLAAAEGIPVRAPGKASVLYSGNFFFSGNVVYLNHGQGLITVYAHLDRFEVEPDQIVNQGDIIGRVGATGRVTGPHLHWGVYLNGTPVNPNLFLVD